MIGKLSSRGILVFIILFSSIAAEPPVTGGFMTDVRDSVYVYWYHPAVNHYELGLLESSPDDYKSVTQTPGYYCMVQAVNLPPMAYINGISVDIYDPAFDAGQIDQPYDPLDLVVFHADSDTLPRGKYFYKGTFVAKGLDEGSRLIISGGLDRNLAGCRLFWAGVEWDFDSPDNPEIMLEAWNYQYFGLNKIGIGDGESYNWQNMTHLLSYRSDILSALPIDSSSYPGVCNKIQSDNPPSGYSLSCFGASESPGRQVIGDSLVAVLPLADIDSVSIASIYDESVENDNLTLIFDDDKILPVKFAEDYDTLAISQGLSTIILENESGDSLHLNIFLESELFRVNPQDVDLGPYDKIDLEISASNSDQDSGHITMRIFESPDGDHYPRIINICCVPDQTTNIIDIPDLTPLPEDYILAYPNPFSAAEPVNFKISPSIVKLEVFDILGRKVKELNAIAYGDMDISWDGLNAGGERLASGMYLIRIMLRDGQVRTKRLVFLK